MSRFIARQDSGGWLLHETRALDELLELKSLGVSIAMSEIYRNVKLTDADLVGEQRDSGRTEGHRSL